VNFNILPLGNAEIFIEFNGFSVNFAVDDFHDFLSGSSNPCSVELYAFIRKTSRNLLKRSQADAFFAGKRKTAATLSFILHPPLHVVASRVSLDSVIYGYWDGRSPEAIAEEFPSLSAEQVYGAIAYYLGHRAEIDGYLQEQSERWRQLQLLNRTNHGPLLDRIRSVQTQAP
jgi:uncharacterized protein (DUF433 family)